MDGVLGLPPGDEEKWSGRVTHLDLTPGRAFAEGVLHLADGGFIHWVGHSDLVRANQHLFHPATPVTVTGYPVGGPIYLTHIQPAARSARPERSPDGPVQPQDRQ